MDLRGSYADGRSFDLPRGWAPVEAPLLDLARTQALTALGATGSAEMAAATARVGAYYDPAGDYAGVLFQGVEPNDPVTIGASDLWAVSTLSMKVPATMGRRLIGSGSHASQVVRQLQRLPVDLPITDLEPGVLDSMAELQHILRSVMSTETTTSNQWVFAAKMCARKRPLLFPVRDSVVCGYLSGWRPMGGGQGQLGQFSRDIQVFAFLMTCPQIISAISHLRSALADSTPNTLDASDLRLLDVALWMAGKAETK